jgi:hypothetical protein
MHAFDVLDIPVQSRYSKSRTFYSAKYAASSRRHRAIKMRTWQKPLTEIVLTVRCCQLMFFCFYGAGCSLMGKVMSNYC